MLFLDTSHKSADILLSTGNIELLLNSRSKEESILAKLYDVKGYLCSQVCMYVYMYVHMQTKRYRFISFKPYW